MATVSGRLVFDRTRTSTYATSMAGIAGVTIALQDLSSGLTITTLTNSTGNYSFSNVANGNFRLIEAFGMAATSATRKFY